MSRQGSEGKRKRGREGFFLFSLHEDCNLIASTSFPGAYIKSGESSRPSPRDIAYRISHIVYRMAMLSPIAYRVSHITCRISHIAYRIMHNALHITYHHALAQEPKILNSFFSALFLFVSLFRCIFRLLSLSLFLLLSLFRSLLIYSQRRGRARRRLIPISGVQSTYIVMHVTSPPGRKLHTYLWSDRLLKRPCILFVSLAVPSLYSGEFRKLIRHAVKKHVDQRWSMAPVI